MTDRPSMTEAISSSLAQQDSTASQKARTDRETTTREQAAASLTADAALYGTAGWDALPAARQARVAAHVRQAQQGGGSDAA